MSEVKRLRHIVSENFNISNCFVKGQKRHNIWETFSTIGSPRKIHGFVFLLNCDCTNTMSDGNVITAVRGDVVYLPPFCEYNSQFFNFSTYDRHGIDDILVDMDFSDENGNAFYLADNMKIFKLNNKKLVYDMFLDILNANDQPIKKMAEIKSIAYKMLSYFGSIDKDRRLKLSKYKSKA